MPIAVKTAVGLHADGHDVMIWRSCITVRSIREQVAHVRLVGKSGQQVDVAHTALVPVPQKMVVTIEIDVVALLRESRARLSVEIDPKVIVEFAQIVDRARHSRRPVAIRSVQVCVRYEQVQHLQRIG